MNGKSDSRRGPREGRRLVGPERRVDALAMGRFIQALRRGSTVTEAATKAGFDPTSFYRKRRSDTEFDAAWREALEASDAPKLIKPGNGRRLQLRRTRRLRFSETKKDVFLAHFAGTADLAASAEAAGVCADTIRNHRLKDPEFAARYQAALEQSYQALEEAAVRERLAALEKLKAGVLPAGEAAVEFDRQMRLLEQWRRRDGSLGPRARSKEALKTWSFDEAMVALKRRLQALKIPVAPPGREAPDCTNGPLHQASPGHAQVRTAPGSSQPFRGKGDRRIPRSGEE